MTNVQIVKEQKNKNGKCDALIMFNKLIVILFFKWVINLRIWVVISDDFSEGYFIFLMVDVLCVSTTTL